MEKKNKGITLISLVVAIVALGIIAGITIQGVGDGIGETKENKLLSELQMVQHSIVERYTKYKLTKDSELLVGTIIELEELPNEVRSWKLSQEEINDDSEKQYRKLYQDDLKELGLEAGEHNLADTYIVNYYTGEVYNSTQQKTTSGELLYITIK